MRQQQGGNNSFVQVHPITAIDRIITDRNENDLNEFITEGILVDVASNR